MKTSEINPSIIGRRVKGIHSGFNVTGTITEIVEDEYSIGVKIKLDDPVFNVTGYGVLRTEWYDTEYESTARKFDGWGNLQHVEFID